MHNTRKRKYHKRKPSRKNRRHNRGGEGTGINKNNVYIEQISEERKLALYQNIFLDAKNNKNNNNFKNIEYTHSTGVSLYNNEGDIDKVSITTYMYDINIHNNNNYEIIIHKNPKIEKGKDKINFIKASKLKNTNIPLTDKSKNINENDIFYIINNFKIYIYVSNKYTNFELLKYNNDKLEICYSNDSSITDYNLEPNVTVSEESRTDIEDNIYIKNKTKYIKNDIKNISIDISNRIKLENVIPYVFNSGDIVCIFFKPKYDSCNIPTDNKVKIQTGVNQIDNERYKNYYNCKYSFF